MNDVFAPAAEPRNMILSVMSSLALTTVEVMFAPLPTYHDDGRFAIVAFCSMRSVTGFAGSVPKVSFVQSIDAVPENASVPSESTVSSVMRLVASVRVPAPSLVSGPAIGAAIAAATPFETMTAGTVNVPPPARTSASARNVTSTAVTSLLSVALSPEFANAAWVELNQSPATPPFDHLPAAVQSASDAPSFQTYSPASVSRTLIVVLPSAKTSA